MAMEPTMFKKGNGAQEQEPPPPADGQEDAAAATAATMAEARHRIHAAVGQIVLALSAVPRYRHQSLADLQALILDPLLRDRIAIASAAPKEGKAGEAPLAGVAIWASVSEAVDGKIREQIRAGAFPVRLKPEDWTSGDKAWLLDVIAPSQKLASAVLANFRQVVKEGDVRVHPIVARMVDPELLKKMGAENGATA